MVGVLAETFMTASRREAFEELSVASSRGIRLNRLAARLLGALHRRNRPPRYRAC